jgi:hypothetical protein
MAFVQKFWTAILPQAWAEAMRAESQSWMMRCPCGFERSIWDSGGVRWKARGSPRRLQRCPQCRKWTWHTVYRRSGT